VSWRPTVSVGDQRAIAIGLELDVAETQDAGQHAEDGALQFLRDLQRGHGNLHAINARHTQHPAMGRQSVQERRETYRTLAHLDPLEHLGVVEFVHLGTAALREVPVGGEVLELVSLCWWRGTENVRRERWRGIEEGGGVVVVVPSLPLSSGLAPASSW